MRNHYIGRTFIQPHQSIRNFGVRVKLNPVRDLIEGRRVVLIDDSIVLSPSPESLQDRQMAIHDLLEGNSFTLSNGMDGPYALRLSSMDNRLIFDLSSVLNMMDL